MAPGDMAGDDLVDHGQPVARRNVVRREPLHGVPVSGSDRAGLLEMPAGTYSGCLRARAKSMNEAQASATK